MPSPQSQGDPQRFRDDLAVAAELARATADAPATEARELAELASTWIDAILRDARAAAHEDLAAAAQAWRSLIHAMPMSLGEPNAAEDALEQINSMARQVGSILREVSDALSPTDTDFAVRPTRTPQAAADPWDSAAATGPATDSSIPPTDDASQIPSDAAPSPSDLIPEPPTAAPIDQSLGTAEPFGTNSPDALASADALIAEPSDHFVDPSAEAPAAHFEASSPATAEPSLELPSALAANNAAEQPSDPLSDPFPESSLEAGNSSDPTGPTDQSIVDSDTAPIMDVSPIEEADAAAAPRAGLDIAPDSSDIASAQPESAVEPVAHIEPNVSDHAEPPVELHAEAPIEASLEPSLEAPLEDNFEPHAEAHVEAHAALDAGPEASPDAVLHAAVHDGLTPDSALTPPAVDPSAEATIEPLVDATPEAAASALPTDAAIDVASDLASNPQADHTAEPSTDPSIDPSAIAPDASAASDAATIAADLLNKATSELSPEGDPSADAPKDVASDLASNAQADHTAEPSSDPSVDPSAIAPDAAAASAAAVIAADLLTTANSEAASDAAPEAFSEVAADAAPELVVDAAPDASAAGGPTELTPEQMAALMSGGSLDSDPGLGGPTELTPEQIAAMAANDSGDMPAQQWGSNPLQLPQDKLELLQFMVADARGSMDQFEQIAVGLAAASTREESAQALRELAGAMRKVSDFFAFTAASALNNLLDKVADAIPTVPEFNIPELLIRVRGIHNLLEQHVRGLEVGLDMFWPLERLTERVNLLCAGVMLHPMILGWHNNDVQRLLELDGVAESIENPPVPPTSAAPEGSAPPPTANAPAASSVEAKRSDEAAATVRIPTASLEKMLETVSQLVLTKNRVVRVSRALRTDEDREERIDEINRIADDLAQLSDALQTALMQARMQPISKLFDRYPRVVRDVASLGDKQVELVIESRGTQVDKNVFDGLGEPLAQLIRMIVSRSIEKPDERASSNKPATATIRLEAENRGAQVLVAVAHDGLPPDRATLLKDAVDAGAVTQDAAESYSDDQVLSLMFHEKTTDPQAASIGKLLRELRGVVSVLERDGMTRIEISIPLSVAIITGILAAVGREIYAIPLQHVDEIVRVPTDAAASIHGRPVMRLREHVVPLVNLAHLLNATPVDDAHAPPGHIGVVVQVLGERAALVVDRIVGKQEIVIKALDNTAHHGELFAGVTVRDDGNVSLILEIAAILAHARTHIADGPQHATDAQPAHASLANAPLADATA